MASAWLPTYNPLFNKTSYQCVGPLPGHPRHIFVWVYVCIKKLVYACKCMRGQAFFLIEFFFALEVYLEVYIGIQEDRQLQMLQLQLHLLIMYIGDRSLSVSHLISHCPF